MHGNLQGRCSVLIVVLICMSGLFSGLTLGLMGLDKVGIEIVLGAGAMEDATGAQCKSCPSGERCAITSAAERHQSLPD